MTLYVKNNSSQTSYYFREQKITQGANMMLGG